MAQPKGDMHVEAALPSGSGSDGLACLDRRIFVLAVSLRKY